MLQRRLQEIFSFVFAPCWYAGLPSSGSGCATIVQQAGAHAHWRSRSFVLW